MNTTPEEQNALVEAQHQAQLSAKDAEIENLRAHFLARLADKDTQIAQLNANVVSKNAQLAAKDFELVDIKVKYNVLVRNNDELRQQLQQLRPPVPSPPAPSPPGAMVPGDQSNLEEVEGRRSHIGSPPALAIEHDSSHGSIFEFCFTI